MNQVCWSREASKAHRAATSRAWIEEHLFKWEKLIIGACNQDHMGNTDQDCEPAGTEQEWAFHMRGGHHYDSLRDCRNYKETVMERKYI